MNIEVIVKVTNGKQIILEKIKSISSNDINIEFYRKLKFDENNIDLIENHFINEWYDNFIDRKSLPYWVKNCNYLQIEIIHN